MSDRPGILILAPFHTRYLHALNYLGNVVYRSWTDSQELLSPEELLERIKECRARIVVVEADFVFEEVFESAGTLGLVGVCRGTANNVDIDAATRHQVLVVNTPGRNAVAVAELTIGLMLSLARHIPDANLMVKDVKWSDPVGGYLSFQGTELTGSTVGVIGLGAIGLEVARRLKALGMRVIAYDPYASAKKARETGASLTDLKTLVRKADFITLHCPVTKQTRGLLGESQFDSMKRSAFLINTAGWEIANENALLRALQEHKITGAAIDTFASHPIPRSSPFLKLDNVVLTPHICGATEETILRHSRMITTAIRSFLNGRRPSHLLNPEAWVTR
jgi:D-3-phosphoglycerate dehydrogenase / 2-oxoglutarate reductase